jgi:hypothetical protein
LRAPTRREKRYDSLDARITILAPGSTMWDGKYFVMTDHESGGEKVEAIIRARLPGSSLIAHGETILTDRCLSDYVDIVSPFIAGKKNTPVNRRLGRSSSATMPTANVGGAMAVSIGD